MGKIIHKEFNGQQITQLPPNYSDYEWMSIRQPGLIDSGNWKDLFFNLKYVNKRFVPYKQNANYINDTFVFKNLMVLDIVNDKANSIIMYTNKGEHSYIVFKVLIRRGKIVEEDYFKLNNCADFLLQSKWRVRVFNDAGWYKIPYNGNYYYILIAADRIRMNFKKGYDLIISVNPKDEFPLYEDPDRASKYYGVIDWATFVEEMPRFSIILDE